MTSRSHPNQLGKMNTRRKRSTRDPSPDPDLNFGKRRKSPGEESSTNTAYFSPSPILAPSDSSPSRSDSPVYPSSSITHTYSKQKCATKTSVLDRLGESRGTYSLQQDREETYIPNQRDVFNRLGCKNKSELESQEQHYRHFRTSPDLKHVNRVNRRQPWPMTFEQLQTMAGLIPSELAVLVPDSEMFIETMKQTDIKCRDLDIIFKILAKIHESEMPASIQRMFDVVHKCQFLEHSSVIYYFAECFQQIYKQDFEKVSLPMKTILGVLQCLGNRAEITFKLNAVILEVEGAAHRILDKHPGAPENTKTTCRAIKETINKIKDSEESTAERRQQHGDSEYPWNHLASIIPPAEIILKPRLASIVPVQLKGPYKNTTEYLERQFQLMREDFISPLRDGIQAYKAWMSEDSRTRFRHQGVLLYQHVWVVDVQPDLREGLMLTLKFDVSSLKKVNWFISKRLNYGCLVCLLTEEKDTVIFARVGSHDIKERQHGLVNVVLEQPQQFDTSIIGKQEFTMVESSAFFEAYRHVLHGLDVFKKAASGKEDTLTLKRSMPFQEYIVDVERDIRSPQCSVITYDFRPLLVEEIEDKRKYKCVCVGQNQEWPEELRHDMGLDRAQFAALHSIATKELAVVQGPPGTGKSFLGLKFLNLLLHNWHRWQDAYEDEDEYHVVRPILVVCYTNHALDQFLEEAIQLNGLRNGLEGRHPVVRVGSRCKSEKLKPHTLPELKRNIRTRGRCHPLRELKLLKGYIDTNKANFELSTRGIIDKNALSDIIPTDFYEEIFGECQSHHPMLDWLGLFDNEIGDSETEPEQRIFNQAMSYPEDNGEVIEEEDFETYQRTLDTIDDSFGPHKAVTDQMKMEVMLEDLESDDNSHDWLEYYSPEACAFLAQNIRSLVKLSPFTSLEYDQLLEDDAWNLHYVERCQMYATWLQRYKNAICQQLSEDMKNYQEASKRYVEAQEVRDEKIMGDSCVIGMTTTAAAKYQRVLQRIGPKVVIVEEAAEIMEANLITSLSSACKHLVLIGDHQQLRPKPATYELERNYNLGVSLFERLILNGLPYEVLQTQYRMRPEISKLLVPHIYEDLLNHKSVAEFDPIQGIAESVYFLDHQLYEDDNDETTHTNKHESAFFAHLVGYLTKNGYTPAQITILTPYNGQVRQIRQHLDDVLRPDERKSNSAMQENQTKASNKDTKDLVRVVAVDNYQGEENDIILLSLVRSNKEGKLGFVENKNRICVALSRARKGLYIMGNATLLKGKSELWTQILNSLEQDGRLGNALPLQCANHTPPKITQVSSSRDFKNIEGGCKSLCDYQLPCGHTCPRRCHPDNRLHARVTCRKPCHKVLCEIGHKCRKQCWQECGNCQVKIRKKCPCGHNQFIPCSVDPEDFICPAPCPKSLSCGHRCQGLCGEPCGTAEDYKEMIKVQLELCGHEVTTECGQQKGTKCKVPCNTQLQCLHHCSGTCGLCKQGRLHQPCKKRCERVLLCSHSCGQNCSIACPPCNRRCEKRCFHSRCPKKCGEPCIPCREKCSLRCRHKACTKECHEKCDISPCDEPCIKILACGHKCIGLCGDKCPKLCRVCDKDEVTEIFFGTEDEPDARFIQLENCGHVFEVSGMDTWMKSDTGGGEHQQSIQLKQCPACKTPIWNSRRYSNTIKEIMVDICKVKKKFGTLALVIRRAKIRQTVQKSCEHFDQEIQQHISNLIDRPVSAVTLDMVENQITFFTELNQVYKKVDKCLVNETACEIKKELGDLKTWLICHKRAVMSDQELTQFEAELQRLNLLLKYHLCRNLIDIQDIQLNDDLANNFDKAFKLLTNGKVLHQESKDLIRTTLKQAKDIIPGLKLSEEEKNMVLKAMDFGQRGHWYKCPKGHIYCITECGGAVQEARCPDCGAAIGGSRHQLRDDNAVATEMDGARHPAFSEDANLQYLAQHGMLD